MNDLGKAIEDTKKYAGKYGQKLRDSQLFLRLISPKVYNFTEIKGNGQKGEVEKEWQRKEAMAKKFVRENLIKMKGIKMVGITGTVAAEAAKKNEDIDLLIITKEDELWWWRLYLRIYVWWKKIPHRKFGKKEKSNEFCFNLWLDTVNLEIPKEKRNLKNATDLIMMKVILDREEIYQRFIRKNTWVKKYLATGYAERRKTPLTCLPAGRSPLEEGGQKMFLMAFIKRIINRILFLGQYIYMQSKTKKKLKNIERGKAFFHERD